MQTLFWCCKLTQLARTKRPASVEPSNTHPRSEFCHSPSAQRHVGPLIHCPETRKRCRDIDSLHEDRSLASSTWQFQRSSSAISVSKTALQRYFARAPNHGVVPGTQGNMLAIGNQRDLFCALQKTIRRRHRHRDDLDLFVAGIKSRARMLHLADVMFRFWST
jgi:hypothetical protein